MPPKTKNNPNSSKTKKGRAPKHQNTFAFRHNPKSKKTEKILSSPNVGVCRRCHDKIEWRKKYRKYKPRTQPGKCNLCSRKNVMAAYHTICTECAGSEKAIAAMEKRRTAPSASSSEGGVVVDDDNDGDAAAASVPFSEEVFDEKESNDEAVENNDNNNSCDQRSISGASHTSSSKNNNIDCTTDNITKSKRRVRVCAVCASEPALSKYNLDGDVDEELIDKIHELEDIIEMGIHPEDGHKMTLREVKGVERELEKLKLEVKERKRRGRVDGEGENEEEGNEDQEEGDGEDDDGASGEDGDGGASADEDAESVDENDGQGANGDDDDDANDPFLLAIGGKDKLLVGEEYQKMLLAKEQSKQRKL
mmetsp:Transcript_8605/g.17902  ORF Transcript_8605/g.17902 Transcript_8605/m.17902 type:complete len:364 (-) Transcript_8605:757-1848(-)